MIAPARTLKMMVKAIERSDLTDKKIIIQSYKHGYTLKYADQIVEYDSDGRLALNSSSKDHDF